MLQAPSNDPGSLPKERQDIRGFPHPTGVRIHTGFTGNPNNNEQCLITVDTVQSNVLYTMLKLLLIFFFGFKFSL